VDPAELARIDAAGLRMLVSIVRKLSAVHGHLTTTNPTPAVRAALMLSGTGLAQPPRDGPP
jgi:anti-anti-sigma regulatory factor